MPEGERISSQNPLAFFFITPMPTLQLDILVVPTYNTLTLAVADASTYPTTPPNVTSPSIEINVPNFGIVNIPFVVNSLNVFTSVNLGISTVTNDPLPDGIYYLKYSVAPANVNFVERTIMRVERLQEKFDEAFMRLDMMECDRAIKTQSKVELTTISFFINGAVAAANNCATVEANRLYLQADKMLNNFLRNNCGCSGNNYATVTTYY
jgi:hypothetical protein